MSSGTVTHCHSHCHSLLLTIKEFYRFPHHQTLLYLQLPLFPDIMPLTIISLSFQPCAIVYMTFTIHSTRSFTHSSHGTNTDSSITKLTVSLSSLISAPVTLSTQPPGVIQRYLVSAECRVAERNYCLPKYYDDYYYYDVYCCVLMNVLYT